MTYQTEIVIGQRPVSREHPAYFIADIAANHDGDIDRAKALIRQAKDAGADAAKFQHFSAPKIVSDAGFRDLRGVQTHQSNWSESVFEVYEKYSLSHDWNMELSDVARSVGIDWMTTPYDKEAVDAVDDLVPAFKIGSGDITWLDLIGHIASKSKPVLMATGASGFDDVEAAVDAVLSRNKSLCVMQCNTNYTGSIENFRYINLRVLAAYAARWPGMPLGLSDHTPGHATVVGAIALGACVIEKHFTDDVTREGPDHRFSMDPVTWKEMVARAREVENALGDGVKRIEENERETAIVQRRAIRLVRDLAAGTRISKDHLEFLRPAPPGSIPPSRIDEVVGRHLKTDKRRGAELRADDLSDIT